LNGEKIFFTFYIYKNFFYSETMCNNNSYTDVSAVLTPPLISPFTLQHYECDICKASYKSKVSLIRHKNTVQKFNA
jgi:hypothetical protein